MKLQGKCQMKLSNGFYVYKGDFFEVADPPEGVTPPEKDAVWMCTRTPWATSLYGQIERAGWVSVEKQKLLSPLKDKKALAQIHAVQTRAKRVSQNWYEMEKAKEKAREKR